MNDLAVVIRHGSHINLTLAGIQFDKFGTKLDQNIIFCHDWAQGFEQAKDMKHTHALFVDSGTMITDWHKFEQILQSYPHQGLIAHLIWHPQKKLHLDPQCWFMELDKFSKEAFDSVHVKHAVPLRSDQNLHDDYTPLWVRPDSQQVLEYCVDEFGQGLIAQQLNSGRGIVNWHNQFRDIKFFAYPNQDIDISSLFGEYIDIAENQFWVLNNENIVASQKSTLLMPGSGLAWILNMVQPSVKKIQIVDISQTQIDFCHRLWSSWDGQDYGGFCWNYIQQKQLRHYELDQMDLTPMQRLGLRSRSKFVNRVNTVFADIMPENFTKTWQQARQSKQLLLDKNNMVKWVLNNNIDQFDSIWCSNILDYKWTLLHTTQQECDQFKLRLKAHEATHQ